MKVAIDYISTVLLDGYIWLESALYLLLKQKRKLILLVDLDSTIITGYKKTIYQTPTKHDFSALDRYFFKRPLLKEFLEDLNPYYEFVVATTAKREYAEAVLKHVDVDGKLFKGRILSREMFEGYKTSFLKYFDLVDRSMIVAIDDLPDVWNNQAFVVEVLDLKGREINDDFYYKKDGISRAAPYLYMVAKSLKQIYQDYYNIQYNNLENSSILSIGDILTNLKYKILENCNICIKYILNDNILKRYIEILKPSIHKEVIYTTTHVIISKLIDVPQYIIDKFPHVKLVTEEWLFLSLKGMIQCDEHYFKPS